MLATETVHHHDGKCAHYAATVVPQLLACSRSSLSADEWEELRSRLVLEVSGQSEEHEEPRQPSTDIVMRHVNASGSSPELAVCKRSRPLEGLSHDELVELITERDTTLLAQKKKSDKSV